MSGRLSGRRVAVIGGGPGGLTAAKSLLDEGLEPTVFEQSQAVGGQWHVGAAHSGVWPGMRTNTSKTLTTFSDFPPPDHWAMFPRAEQIQAHHAAYAERFGVTRRLCLGAMVTSVEAASDGYAVTWSDSAGLQTDHFNGVIVASGRYNRPSWPQIEGLESFSGIGGVRHSFDYPGREKLAGQRVVVLGNSISGLELASDLAIDDSITVYSAFRKPRYVLPRVAAGVPSDWRFFTRIAAYLPLVLPLEAVAAGLKDSVLAVAGHPAQYGAPSPDENIFIANISLCQHWLAYVAEGRLQIRPNIVRVDGSLVIFADGSSAEVDAIICATGYDLTLPLLSDEIRQQIQTDTKTLDLYHHTFHPDLPGLAFVGLYHLVGPYAPVLELQGRWIAMAWAGIRELPDVATLRAGIIEWQHQKQLTHDVLLHAFAVMLADDAGVAPDLAARPEVTRALLFGPLAPAQFRLDGHGSQTDALELYTKALGSFAGDTSSAPTPSELDLLGTLVEPLGEQIPALTRAYEKLMRLVPA